MVFFFFPFISSAFHALAFEIVVIVELTFARIIQIRVWLFWQSQGAKHVQKLYSNMNRDTFFNQKQYKAKIGIFIIIFSLEKTYRNNNLNTRAFMTDFWI